MFIKSYYFRVLETKRLSSLLEEILYSKSSSNTQEDEASNSLTVLQNNLQFYRSQGLTGLKALLKAEKVQNSGSK